MLVNERHHDRAIGDLPIELGEEGFRGAGVGPLEHPGALNLGVEVRVEQSAVVLRRRAAEVAEEVGGLVVRAGPPPVDPYALTRSPRVPEADEGARTDEVGGFHR